MVKRLRHRPLTAVTRVRFPVGLPSADMAELADAHGSGPCEGYFMGVRIPLSAPNQKDIHKDAFFSIHEK